MTDWTLCVDFGTAFSKAAAAPAGAWTQFNPAQVRPLQLNPHADGNAFLLDSAVFVDQDRILFGRPAIARADALSGRKRTALRSFKTLLGVSDLDRTLNIKAPLSIDPHRAFRMRDLIVLYLAYLLTSVQRARGLDPLIKGRIAHRYAAPAWRDGDSAALHAVIVRLFGEAEALRTRLGEEFLSEAGIGVAEAIDELANAQAHPQSLAMGLIHEATAAAAYTSVGLNDSASHLIVVDMGAGTTDFAALVRIGDQIFELAEARTTLNTAGDFIDRIVANRALDLASWAKTTAQKTALWAELMRGMRETKATLFEEGRVSMRHAGRVLTIAMRDVERDKDFQLFAKELKAAYDQCVTIVRGDALVRQQAKMEAVAVGGGAAAPFIQSLIASHMKRGPIIAPRPATPDWAFAEEFRGNLAPVFPQLAIAIGGALAPETMLAARG